MVLQAYIDDSRDQGELFVLAGYIASAEQWAEFSKEWEAALPNSTLQKDGTYRFKMSEMAWRGRTDDIGQFHKIINDHVIMSIAFILDERELNRAVDRVHVDLFEYDLSALRQPFEQIFTLLMDQFHKLRIDKPEMVPVDGVIDFYFDETSEKGPILRQWDEFMAHRFPQHRALYGATPRFEKDEDFLPIQAADFHAWWVRRWAKEHGPDHVKDGDFSYANRTAKPIYNLVMHITEDQLVETFISDIKAEYPGAPVRDLKPIENVDGPFPVERAASAIKRWIRRVVARP